MSLLARILCGLAFVVIAPLCGGLFDGIDRKLSARMQGRVGPSIYQSFYDVRKLFYKKPAVADPMQTFLVASYMILLIMTGTIFFTGNDILMCFFVLSTAMTFLYFAAIISSSPYATIAAGRELVQAVCYEPAVLLTAVGFYLATNTFDTAGLTGLDTSLIVYMPGFFIAFVFAMVIKMRKSPFDVSTSHHAHQELVGGVATEMSGRNLAFFHITEWYENVFLFGVISLFFLNNHLWSIPLALAADLVVFFFLVLLDNSSARVKWKNMLGLSWIVTLLTAGVNLLVLMLVHLV